MFSKSLLFIFLTWLSLHDEHVDGIGTLQRKFSWWKKSKSDKYCNDDEYDSDDDYDYDDYGVEDEEEDDGELHEVIRELDEMYRRSNRRWYSRFRLKPAKKKTKIEKRNKKEDILLKKARKLFRKGNFEEAARCCTAAIKNNPNSENYMNRALCYLNSNDWDSAVIDLRAVLKKNPYHVRSHYLLGLVLLELKNLDLAIEHLQKAHDVGKEKQADNEDIVLIASQLQFAREKQKSILEKKELFSYLRKLILEDTLYQTSRIEKESGNNGEDEVSQNEIKHVNLRSEQILNRLNTIFLEYRKTLQRRLVLKEDDTDVPGYLCDNITLELFKEPIITPRGITYEKEVISQLLDESCESIGSDSKISDPISREDIYYEQLIPNKALKEAVEAFIRENDRVKHFLDTNLISNEVVKGTD